MQSTRSVVVLIVILIAASGCKIAPVKREIKRVNEIQSVSPSNKFVKAHMKDGKVYILYNWHFDSGNNIIDGHGVYLDVNRNLIEERGKSVQNKNPFQVSLTDVALIETNDPGRSVAGPLAVVTGIVGAVSVFCVVNPKACFGSCPTFYASDGDSLLLQAEGFSTSVSPSLEKNDVDMLYYAKPSLDFTLKVTNEALETHCINYANILAFEKQPHERVFHSSTDLFLKCSSLLNPTACKSESGDCLDLVSAVDNQEYFSLADSTNLDSKEELILEFEGKNSGSFGLVIGKRQTLLTTFLMYQGLAYMGNGVTYWLSEFEMGNEPFKKKDVFEILGGIEVFSEDVNGNWISEGSIHETGPIATDFNIVQLHQLNTTKKRVKLRINKGLWRIDYLALASIDKEVRPLVIEPYAVETIHGTEENALRKLKDANQYMVTYPGEAYNIRYKLPSTDVELFLDSRGYYLEWIREQWVREQSFTKLNMMVNKPAKYLKYAAPHFKKLEPSMEETFWNSRYVQH